MDFSKFSNHRQADDGTSGLLGAVLAMVAVAVLWALVGLRSVAAFAAFGGFSLIAAGLTWAVFSRLDIWTPRHWSALVADVCWRWTLVFMIVLFSAYVTKNAESLSRLVMLLWWVLCPLALMLAVSLIQWGLSKHYQDSQYLRRGVFVNVNPTSAQLYHQLKRHTLLDVDPIGYFHDEPSSLFSDASSYLGGRLDLMHWVRSGRVDVVYFGMQDAQSKRNQDLLEQLQDTTVSLYFVPDVSLFPGGRLQVSEMAGVPMLRSTETPFLGASRWIKRVMDVIISGVLLTILAPLMLGIALLIKLTSPGPVLFRQERYGVGGKCIGVLKFRSMTHNRPSDGVQQATRGDARITPLGRILRKTSLDELPQFLNVLMGSMSVVGPRPHAVEHNELYRRKIKGYMLRHKVKPGITGLAQVSGFRGETDALEKMEARIGKDLEYINRWSLWLDIQIIIRTIGVVVYDKNAY